MPQNYLSDFFPQLNLPILPPQKLSHHKLFCQKFDQGKYNISLYNAVFFQSILALVF